MAGNVTITYQLGKQKAGSVGEFRSFAERENALSIESEGKLRAKARLEPLHLL